MSPEESNGQAPQRKRTKGNKRLRIRKVKPIERSSMEVVSDVAARLPITLSQCLIPTS
ncbi:MAG: hypothetical protein ACFFEF_07450 [Candidatus Thorarchaeota archaeon]